MGDAQLNHMPRYHVPLHQMVVVSEAPQLNLGQGGFRSYGSAMLVFDYYWGGRVVCCSTCKVCQHWSSHFHRQKKQKKRNVRHQNRNYARLLAKYLPLKMAIFYVQLGRDSLARSGNCQQAHLGERAIPAIELCSRSHACLLPGSVQA